MRNLFLIPLIFFAINAKGQTPVSNLSVFPTGSVVNNGNGTGSLDLDKIINGNATVKLALSIATAAATPASVKAVADQEKADNAATNSRIDYLSAGTVIVPVKTITASTYTITQADNGGILRFASTCTVFYSGLQSNFSCKCLQLKGTLTFSGTYLSKFGYLRSQTIGAWVEVIATGNEVCLKGDLKN